MSTWIKAISQKGSIRGVVLNATDLVRQLASIHRLDGVGARGLGEAAMAALLQASYCKQGERVNINIQGSRRLKQAIVEARPGGTCRGYLIETEADSGPTETNPGPWGEGLMAVLRTQDQEGKQPYIGTVPLVTGHLAKDYTFYWVQSEQVPTACGLSVVTDGNAVVSAGAFLIQTMPGALPEEIDRIAQAIRNIDHLDQKLSAATQPGDFLAEIFQDEAYFVLETRNLKMECQCSAERVERALLLIGGDEIEYLLNHPEHANVQCDFCRKEYLFDEIKLRELMDRARQK